MIALVGALLALLAAPVAASAAGTLDQSQTADPTTAFGGFNDPGGFGEIWEAQTFTAGMTGNLDHVDLNLEEIDFGDCDPGPLTVEIRSTSGGNPTSTVLATATLPRSSVGTNLHYVSVPFTPPPPIVAGTQYAIVLNASAQPLDCFYAWYGTQGNPYAAGQSKFTNDAGSSWHDNLDPRFSDTDLNFRTFVVTKPPEPTSKDQCKHDGWRNFRGFKNQGDCVSFVATQGRNPPAGT